MLWYTYTVILIINKILMQIQSLATLLFCCNLTHNRHNTFKQHSTNYTAQLLCFLRMPWLGILSIIHLCVFPLCKKHSLSLKVLQTTLMSSCQYFGLYSHYFSDLKQLVISMQRLLHQQINTKLAKLTAISDGSDQGRKRKACRLVTQLQK